MTHVMGILLDKIFIPNLIQSVIALLLEKKKLSVIKIESLNEDGKFLHGTEKYYVLKSKNSIIE